MSQDDEILSREKLTRLWSEAEPSVRAFAFSAVKGYQDAEDIAQQVALTVARRFHEYDEKRPFVAWVLWIAKSHIVDHYRRVAREQRHLPTSVLDQVADLLSKRQPDRPARQAALESCFQKLPEKSKMLLEMRYLDHQSIESVASAIKSTGGAVRVMLFRVRKLLADCIQSQISKEVIGK